MVKRTIMNNQIIFCAVEVADIVTAIYFGDFIVSEIKKQFREQNFVTITVHSIFAETKSGLSCQPTISSHSTSKYTFYFFSFFLFCYYDYLIIFFLKLVIHFWANLELRNMFYLKLIYNKGWAFVFNFIIFNIKFQFAIT